MYLFSFSVPFLALVFSSCAHTHAQDSKYPAHWWTPVPEAGAPSWEVLPQAAKAGEVILSKRNELGILSNFAHTPFTYKGKHYESVEGFWQMMLYPENADDPRAKSKDVTWKYTRDQVSQMIAFEAKGAGELAKQNMKTLGIDWCSFEGKHFTYRTQTKGVHYQLILEAMTEKLNQNPKVREILLSTGDLVLKPDHHPEVNSPPEWLYFEIWMELRKKIQDGKTF